MDTMQTNLMILIDRGNQIEGPRKLASQAGQTLANAYLFITGRMTCAEFFRW